MHPTLFEFEFLNRTWNVRAYGTAIVIASVVLLLTSLVFARSRGVSRRAIFVCFIVGAASMLLGARLLFWVTNLQLYREHPARFFATSFGDFSLFGGLILACAVLPLVCRIAKWNTWALADVFVPGVFIAIAIVRIGCFLRGCCFGVRSDLPWAVTFPSGSLAHFHQMMESPAAVMRGPLPVHPVQLYELIAALFAATIAMALLARRARVGLPFLSAMICFIVCRLFLDSLRPIGATFTGTTWLYPMLYASLAAAVIAAMRFRMRSPKLLPASTSRPSPAVRAASSSS